MVLLLSACQKEAATPTAPILSTNRDSIVVGDTVTITVANNLENYTCLTWSHATKDSLGNSISGNSLTVAGGNNTDLSWSLIPQNAGIYYIFLIASNCENRKVDCHQNCPSADNGDGILIVVQ